MRKDKKYKYQNLRAWRKYEKILLKNPKRRRQTFPNNKNKKKNSKYYIPHLMFPLRCLEVK